ncbi:MAG: ATP-binding protein, partial [Anaerolineaceae bacterium]
IDVIRKASGRLEKLIDDLILYSTAQRNGILLVYREFSITEMAAQVIARYQPAAMRKNISLLCQCGADIPLVNADEGKVGWVLAQLLDNALKFTPNGGQILLTVELEEQSVLVTVKDSGIGIPPDRLSEIFEPFHQLDGSTTRTYGGTGLGLSLVKRIIESHNEDLMVSSTPDQGSSFGFHLKLA